MKTQTENPQTASIQAAIPQAADLLTENQPAENLKAVHLPEANLKADHWLTAIDSDNRLQQTLSCFLPRGIATREQVEVLTGMSQHPVRDTLKMLTEPPGGLSPLLKPLNVSLPGRRGRSQAAYLLTQEGASAFEDQTRHSPVLTQSVEAAHALMEMQVYIAAFQANLPAAVEKVLFYEGTRNIRVDVLVGSTALFEIEQSAQRKDVPRIATKLEHLQHFYATQTAKGIDTRVRVLFGLSATDGKTITIWRQVLGAVVGMKGEIQFEIYWQYIADFLANPDWNDIASFTKLEPSIPNQPPSQKDNNPTLETKSTVLPEFVSRGRINLEEINLVMYALDSTTDSNEGIETDQRQQFFEIIETIYDGSHYRGGPVLEKAAFSVTSLTLLFRFLHLHQNRTLLEQLQASYKNVLSSQRKGISFFRVTLTRFYWDVFLRYFDFGRGGPLKVKVEVPSFEDDSSEIYTSVKIYNRYLLVDENREVAEDEPKHAEESLAWVLDALYLYSYDLGLMNPDTKTKRSEHGD